MELYKYHNNSQTSICTQRKLHKNTRSRRESRRGESGDGGALSRRGASRRRRESLSSSSYFVSPLSSPLSLSLSLSREYSALSLLSLSLSLFSLSLSLSLSLSPLSICSCGSVVRALRSPAQRLWVRFPGKTCTDKNMYKLNAL